jgi:hypothetical protein
VSEDPQHVQHKLHAALEMATALLDLPLTWAQRETLTIELTGPVRALIAEALAQAGDDAPVRYAVTESTPATADEDTRFEVSEFAGCTTRISLDVDLDSPAGTVAGMVRRQPETTAIEIRDAHTVAVTISPRSLDAWRWWLTQLQIRPDMVALQDTVAEAIGTKDGATVHLRGEGVPAMYDAGREAAWLIGLVPSVRP